MKCYNRENSVTDRNAGRERVKYSRAFVIRVIGQLVVHRNGGSTVSVSRDIYQIRAYVFQGAISESELLSSNLNRSLNNPDRRK